MLALFAVPSGTDVLASTTAAATPFVGEVLNYLWLPLGITVAGLGFLWVLRLGKGFIGKIFGGVKRRFRRGRR